MERIGLIAIMGALAVICGLALAIASAGDAVVLLAGILAGVGLTLLLTAARRWSRGDLEPEEEPAIQPVPTPTPGVDDLLGALDEPLLLVEGRMVVRANAAAVAMLGEHMVGEDVRVAVRYPAATELLTREGNAAGSVEIIGIDHPDRHWTLSVQPLGPATRVVRLTDRTATRATERMRVDFVANASHELRTPLASLIGFIETLEDANGPDDAAVRERFLGIMAGEARRMQRLVDDLISLSRIEADKHRAPADAVSLVALAKVTDDDGNFKAPAAVAGQAAVDAFRRGEDPAAL